MLASMEPLYAGLRGGEKSCATPERWKYQRRVSAMNAEPLSVFSSQGAPCRAKSSEPEKGTRLE
jgi:hypothetical protein